MKKLSIALALLFLTLIFHSLAEEADDPFVGRWQDPIYGRAVLEIGREDGGYSVTITWGNSADSNGEWEMHATRDGNRLAYTGGTMSIVTYGAGGEETNRELLYDDAEGAFTLTDEGKLLWEDSREDRAPEFNYEKLRPTEGQTRFAELTGLAGLREKLNGGATILRAYYTDGYGFSTSEFTTEDASEIKTLLDALEQIEVVGKANEEITDWYPQIVFYLSDDTRQSVTFDGHWLEIGGMENYELANDEDFWSLTAYLVQAHEGVGD